MILGVDASRLRSGGAMRHLVGLLSEADPARHGVREIHVWTYKALRDVLPQRTWLTTHCPDALERSLLRQVLWQRYAFPAAAKTIGCDVVLNADAGTVARFRPGVTMSQDMLSYEPGVIQRFGLSRARLRLVILRYLQNRSFRLSDGVIFLTRYAAKVIQTSSGSIKRVAFVPHGVGADFKSIRRTRNWPANGDTLRCLYVSNASMYKHQWEVVHAFARLRARGFDVKLVLVGGGTGRAQKLVDTAIEETDPHRTLVEQVGAVPPEELPKLLASADLFVFASSCENMPNTLVEAMAASLPIACSDRGPMPEILEDGGVYFDPTNPESIATAVERIITDSDMRSTIAARAKELSEQYSWSRCAEETLTFLAETHRNSKALNHRHIVA